MVQKYNVSLLYAYKNTIFRVMKKYILHSFILFTVCFSSCDEKPNTKNDAVIKIDENIQSSSKILPYNLANRIKSTDDLTYLFETIEESPLLEQFTKNKGPFTLFAPSNAALEEIDILNNGVSIEDVLKKYMVPGKITTVALTKKIRSNGGSYSIKTLGGTTLVAYKVGNVIYLKNIKGDKAEIGKSDIV